MNSQELKPTTDEQGFAVVNLEGDTLPDLANADTIPFDLVDEYWKPELEGEFKNLFFLEIGEREVLDNETNEVKNLSCAIFLEKTATGVQTISNGSKRLVGIFEGGRIQRGTALRITYKGEKKNSTNSFKSHTWSVKPLKIQQPKIQ